jgi:hypothetical protein
VRFCSRLRYPTAPPGDAKGCYTEIRIEYRHWGAISPRVPDARAATPLCERFLHVT